MINCLVLIDTGPIISPSAGQLQYLAHLYAELWILCDRRANGRIMLGQVGKSSGGRGDGEGGIVFS